MNPDLGSVAGKSKQGNLQLEDFVDHQRVCVMGDGLDTVGEGKHLVAAVDLPEAHSHELAVQVSQLLGHGKQAVHGFTSLLRGVCQSKNIQHLRRLEEELSMCCEVVGKLLVEPV